MAYNLSSRPLLTPFYFLDSTCYSAEGPTESSSTRPVPFAFDSDESMFDSESSTDQQLSPTPPDPPVAEGEVPKQPPQLLPTPGSKPPRPALLRPLNIAAYTKRKVYGTYIDNVLTPAPIETARSSLSTIVDEKALLQLRKVNGLQFSELVAFELGQQRHAGRASTSWIRDVLFPADAVPPGFNAQFQKSIMWDKNKWHSMPKALTERGLERWLNWVARSFAGVFDLYNNDGGVRAPYFDRSWDKRTANSGPTGGTHYRKPDISLLSRSARAYLNDKNATVVKSKGKGKKARPGWPIIEAIVEVTISKRSLDEVVRNIIEKAYLMFECQPFRRFVIALGFFGPLECPQWVLVLIDRAGVITSSEFQLNDTDGITLAKVLFVLVFGKPKYIGIDETMIIDPHTGAVTHIAVAGEEGSPSSNAQQVFKVVRLLHSTSQVSGCATRVWLVSRHDGYYILKDSWPLQSRPFSEIRHLRKINDTILSDPKARLSNTFPLFVAGEEFDDSTDDRRMEISDKPLPRVHRRIVTKPIGDPLTSFRSKFEFCSILCDVVTYLEYITRNCHVCHGDISINNIVINRVWEDGTSAAPVDDDAEVDADDDLLSSSYMTITDQPRVPSSGGSIRAFGLTIDYDNSFSLDEISEHGYRVNSGTLPFMAIESLQWNKSSEFVHKPRHDLESLFYVILAVCSYCIGPGILRSHIPEADEMSVPMNEWWGKFDRHILARTKAAHISSFTKCILNRLPPYWQDFRPVLQELRSVIWRENCMVSDQNNVATHDAFLQVLAKAQDRYRIAQEEPVTYAFVADTGASKGQKRKEGGDDVQGREKAVRAEGSKRIMFDLPHNIQQQSFTTYIDSGDSAMSDL